MRRDDFVVAAFVVIVARVQRLEKRARPIGDFDFALDERAIGHEPSGGCASAWICAAFSDHNLVQGILVGPKCAR